MSDPGHPTRHCTAPWPATALILETFLYTLATLPTLARRKKHWEINGNTLTKRPGVGQGGQGEPETSRNPAGRDRRRAGWAGWAGHLKSFSFFLPREFALSPSSAAPAAPLIAIIGPSRAARHRVCFPLPSVLLPQSTHRNRWAASGIAPAGGMLCLACLERRINRPLTMDDFDAIVPSKECWQRYIASRTSADTAQSVLPF
jgi:hypothetical protein